jgi:DNA-binding GntR family transcriptional regulator
MAVASRAPVAPELLNITGFEPATPLPERVYETLEQSIVDGILRPGMHLVEDDLARRLGVSRNPVRQALQRLAHEGFVKRQPGKGAFVHSPSPQEIDDIFHVRTLLESDCARLAAERITDSGLQELGRILDLGRAAVELEDAGQLLELNDLFHGVIIRAANNPVMERLMISLRRRIRWYFSSVVVTRATGSWKQHEEIYHALRARDGDTCAALMAVHVGQTLEKIQGNQRLGNLPALRLE